jgi:hypothetical protein
VSKQFQCEVLTEDSVSEGEMDHAGPKRYLRPGAIAYSLAMGLGSAAIGGFVAGRVTSRLQMMVWVPVTIAFALFAVWLAESDVTTTILNRCLRLFRDRST